MGISFKWGYTMFKEKCFEFIKSEMQRTHGKSLCAKCGLACPYTKEYLGIETDRDLIKEI